MASIQQPLRRDPFQSDPRAYRSNLPKSIPILPSASLPSQGDPMDVSQSSNAPMGPPSASPNGEKSREQQQQQHQQQDQDDANGSSSQPTGAAAAAQQPKVVQTAFIHKLYKFVLISNLRYMQRKLTSFYSMLEDQNIQHLISWSSTNESFVMSPSSEFSKVLAYVEPESMLSKA